MVPLRRSRALDLAGVSHGFTTREGGVSTGRLGTLNLGRRPAEPDDTLAENWRRVAAALDPRLSTDAIAIVSQVHGRQVRTTSVARGPLEPLGDADALVTTVPGLAVAIR